MLDELRANCHHSANAENWSMVPPARAAGVS